MIDNADIRYMTRIEIQGGGDRRRRRHASAASARCLHASSSRSWARRPLTQFNRSAKAMTISNSNLGFFSDAAIFAHPGCAPAIVTSRPNPPACRPSPGRGSRGERDRHTLFLYSNTITNMPTRRDPVHSRPSTTTRCTNADDSSSS